MHAKTAAAVAIMILAIALVPMLQTDAASGTEVLIDEGDGNTQWQTGSGTTVYDVVRDAATSAGMSVTYTSGVLAVDGVSSKTTGSASTGGTITTSGTTGVRVTSSWSVFGWTGSAWTEVSPTDSADGYTHLAIAFYPEGTAPVETPDNRNVWTMVRGDAGNTGSQDATYSATSQYSTQWYSTGSAYANALYAGGYVFQKYGIQTSGEHLGEASLVCFDLSTGEALWTFYFESGANYESSTPLIVGEYIYVATMTGYIYKIPWATGPGDDNENVTSINGTSFSDATKVPNIITTFDEGASYDSGFTSMVVSAGAIYVTHSNGMVYCFDLDLNLVWSHMLDCTTYFIAPTVVDGYVFTSALNGHLYILDAADGSVIVDEVVYQVTIRDRVYGGLGQIAVLESGSSYSLIFTVTDGRGMDQSSSGLAVYTFDPSSSSVERVYLNTDLGTFGRYVSPVSIQGFTGAYVTVSDGAYTSLIRISTDGTVETMTTGLAEIHASGVTVNGEWIYLVSYSAGDPLYRISLSDGTIDGVAYCAVEVRNFNMCAVLVLGDTIVGGNDAGIYSLYGTFAEYSDGGSGGAPVIVYIGAIAGVIVLVLAGIWAALRYGKGVEKPFAYLKGRFLHYLYGDTLTHNTRNRHRLKFVLIVGLILIFVSFTACISIGSTSVLNPIDAYSYLFSAIAKGGVGLDVNETLVFVSRLPRTLAALAVGIGLAVAGSVYQAIIRNPLVDPYIMGVSSGAGIAAIAVIAFDFTFFGLFSSHSIFLTAISAMIGGLVAFGCTMVIAEKAGGSSINYVLSGVVVGLAFSALQTIMLTMSGNKLSNALTWLYGSFAEVTWAQVGVVFFLSLFLSLVPLFWAKEFNLVLLGEDQAREMGLNVRRFNRTMLILASVLTSVCVAFCGIIGFVGLVIPHLCRMLLGSDHRMVLPASILFGGIMLMLADLLARTGYYGIELPVGAITTVIGIPVFAYLLIKKGRIYDG
ncbi:MAG: iron chelate uptake ABC transporter family permease subunit [Thermoplasmata archaeon]|nr:iron chelate uptake ABC transporter family permease subunit [Thermoplasmata archaeon]